MAPGVLWWKKFQRRHDKRLWPASDAVDKCQFGCSYGSQDYRL